ncbi:MAG: outer membrane protein transport protein [Hyphomicrobiales bacterium]|nr:outer membrane protein transport protein [Hyphomicrobiales bacterium]
MKSVGKATIMAGIAAFALTAVSVPDVLAGGFAVREQSTELQGMSFAGAAAGSTGLGSMYFNPATITQHDGFVSDSNLAFIIASSEAKGATATTFGGVSLNGLGIGGSSENIGSGILGDVAPVPASYYSYQWNEMIYLGLSLNSPYGLETKSGAYVGGPHGYKSRITNIVATPTVGMKLSEKLSLAAGVQVSYLDGRLTTAFPGTQATLTEVEGDDFGVGFVAGLTFDLTEHTTVGVGFRSEIEHTLKGSFFTATIPTTTRMTADVTLPAQATVSVSHQLNEQFKVAASAEWTDWSTLQSLIIQTTALGNIPQTFDWQDGWFFSLGGEYAYTDALTLRAGVAYELTPVTDLNRGPRVPDNDRVWVSVGGTYDWSDWIALHGSYTHIFMKDGGVNLPATPLVPSLTANFEQSVDIASVGATLKW